MRVLRVQSNFDSWMVMLDGNKHYRLYKDEVVMLPDAEYRALLVFLEELSTRPEIEPEELLQHGFQESIN